MSAVHCLINIVMIVVLSLLISMWWQESLLLEQDVKQRSSSEEDTKASNDQKHQKSDEPIPDDSRSGNVEQSEAETHEELKKENTIINNTEDIVNDNGSHVSGNGDSQIVGNNNVSPTNVSSNISSSTVTSRSSSSSDNNNSSVNQSCSCSCKDKKERHLSDIDSAGNSENAETTKGQQQADSIGSSVVCAGATHWDRQCYFHNLYYLPLVNEFAFLHTAESEITGVPRDRFNPALLDLSSVADHNAQYLNYIDLAVSEEDPIYKNLTEASVIDEPCLIMRRFNPDNLMHIFHDDLLPIYHTIRTWNKTSRFMSTGKSKKQLTEPLDESASLRLVFTEGWDPGLYADLYKIFSVSNNYTPLYIERDIKSLGQIVRFRSAVVGLSKHTVWYQYGFIKPQGPVENSLVTGYDIRSFSRYMRERLDEVTLNSPQYSSAKHCHSTVSMPSGDQYQQESCSVLKKSDLVFGLNTEEKDGLVEQQQTSDGSMVSAKRTAVLLKRKSTRLILNELELSLSLAQKLSARVVILSLETHSVREIIDAVSACDLLIGMHGSLIILSIFLPPNAQVIELFPYAVNPSSYTPYRTLTGLPGMNIHYSSWRNLDKSQSIPHPDWPPDLGGISHLSEEEQREIEEAEEVGEHLCCSDPDWLYHINQDTRVDVRAVIELALSAISQQLDNNPVRNSNIQNYQIFPSRVINITCQYNDQDKALVVNWNSPVNLAYIGNGRAVSYELWLQEVGHVTGDYTAWILKPTSHAFTVGTRDTSDEDSLVYGLEYNVWVRCLLDEGLTVGPFVSPSSPCRTF